MKITVISGGISGMLTACMLCEEHEMTVHEATPIMPDYLWLGKNMSVFYRKDMGHLVPFPARNITVVKLRKIFVATNNVITYIHVHEANRPETKRPGGRDWAESSLRFP